MGDDVLPEIREVVVEQLEEDLPVEQVDAHGAQEELLIPLDAELSVGGPVQP
jgi:hypothetical protein